MKISEETYTIDSNGCLKIPSAHLQSMGMYPGEHVRVAYLADESDKNIFNEFLLTNIDFAEEQLETVKFILPADLMQAANIESNTDIQISCIDGAIIISKEEALDVSALKELSSALDIATDFLTQIAENKITSPIAMEKIADAYGE